MYQRPLPQKIIKLHALVLICITNDLLPIALCRQNNTQKLPNTFVLLETGEKLNIFFSIWDPRSVQFPWNCHCCQYCHCSLPIDCVDDLFSSTRISASLAVSWELFPRRIISSSKVVFLLTRRMMIFRWISSSPSQSSPLSEFTIISSSILFSRR